MELESKDTYDFLDAMDFVRSGSKVSRLSWEEVKYLSLYLGELSMNETDGYVLTEEDMLSNDWYTVLV